jgi:catechol 2,3-dioxygenase-like lactoylglutathione lyase family enzyme
MPTLDTYRKQAKLLLRWHRDQNYTVGGKLRQLRRFRALTDREALALDFTLALAQEIVAVEAGFGSWAELKATTADAPKTPRPAAGPPTLKVVAPVLPVLDVAASAAWYRDRLGFAVDFLHGAPPFYGSLSRDGVRLHLRFVHEPVYAPAAQEEALIQAFVEVSNVQGLYEEMRASGADIAQPLVKQAWGGTDFVVRDPDGNGVAFVALDQV